MKTETIAKNSQKAEPSERWCFDLRKNQPYSFEQFMEAVEAFHGNVAPGLVIGGKMVDLALSRLPGEALLDAVCETRNCLPDAVQMLTPCTAGNNWLKIVDLGRFALSLYDKYSGQGVRVFLDPAKLADWPDIESWFFKQIAKKDQDPNRLYGAIHAAGKGILGVFPVRIHETIRKKVHKGAIGICPQCQEAYPVQDGPICRGCAGSAPYEKISK